MLRINSASVMPVLKRILVIAFLLCPITGIISCSSSDKTERVQLRIGVAGVLNTESCRTYLAEQFKNFDFQIIELGEGDDDAFSNVGCNIEYMVQNKELDMIIGVPEDYIRSLPNSLFQNLQQKVDINHLLPAVEGHLLNKSKEMYYVTTTLYCTRFLIANCDLLDAINIPVPDSISSFSELIKYIYSIHEAIEKYSLQNTFAISLGSPVDEFLFDDIANLLLPLGYPRTEAGIQTRFFDSNYTDQYKEILKCALIASYKRADIGQQYTSDFYFSTGNVALKSASAFEMRMFNTVQSDAPYNPYIDSFTYSVIPITQVLNTQSTVSAISINTDHSEECLEIVKFLLGEEHAIDVLNNSSPFLIDSYSFPCYYDEKEEKTIKELYGVNLSQTYIDYTNYEFAKNSIVHWSVIQQEQNILQDAFGGGSIDSVDEVIERLKNIDG